jgi:hypothetical protein
MGIATMDTTAHIACGFVDVVRDDGAQPRFLLQPHLSGGAVALSAFTLEIEGARALVQHLNTLILEAGAK